MILRAPELSDVDALYLWENDPDRLMHGRVGLPYSRHSIWEYVKQYNDNALPSGHVRLMFDTDHLTPSGVVDIYDIDSSALHAYVSIYVATVVRNQGLGLEALSQAKNFALNHLGLNQLAAFISCDNSVSISLFEKAGFKKIAFLPEWVRGRSGSLTAAFLYLHKLNCENND